MLELVKELAEYERAPDAVTVTTEHFTESGFGEKPVWWAFVAEVDGTVQGFAMYYIRFSTWKGQRMYLEDLLVTETMRGNRIGKMLFDRLIEECKEKGFSAMVWQVLDWNEPSIEFYRSQGGALMDDWTRVRIDGEALVRLAGA